VLRFAGIYFTGYWYPPPPPIDSIRAMTTVWKLGGKIIRTVLCCTVYDCSVQPHAPLYQTEPQLHGGPKKWYRLYIYYIVREVSLFWPTRYVFVCSYTLSVVSKVVYVYLYSALRKAPLTHSDMDHSFTCKLLHHACRYSPAAEHHLRLAGTHLPSHGG